MKQIRHFLIGAVCLVSITASAQWQWIDKDGRRVFSDRAPPADILEKNVVKRPGGRGIAPSTGNEPVSADTATASTTVASAPKLGGIDKELMAKKKKAEEAEADKRKADEEARVKAKVENCARAKQAKASLDSNRRISRTNDKGEAEILDDAARAAELKRIQSIMATDCQ